MSIPSISGASSAYAQALSAYGQLGSAASTSAADPTASAAALAASAGTGATTDPSAVLATDPTSTDALSGVGSSAGSSFGSTLASSLEQVQQLQSTSSDLAVKAATGDLEDVHDYTIAAAQAQMATEVTVALRNKALDAFNEIMRMQV